MTIDEIARQTNALRAELPAALREATRKHESDIDERRWRIIAGYRQAPAPLAIEYEKEGEQ
jgi:hypothetical protein